MPSKTVNVFVSYSHADASLVAPVVRLLRVNQSLVFQDTDQIPPGKRWRDEIAKALAESNLVVVFWCDHASRSNEVSKEWRTAIEQDKDLLPLLLDETPLPSELSNFQWIDFRGTVGANHRPIAQYSRQERRPIVWRLRKFLYTLLAVASVASFLRTIFVRLYAPSSIELVLWILLSLGTLAGAYLWLRHLWFRRLAKPEERIETTRRYPEEVEREIARGLQAAIIRRTGIGTEWLGMI